MMFSVLRTILNNEVLRTISLSTEHLFVPFFFLSFLCKCVLLPPISENNQLIPLLNYNPFPSFSDSLLVM